MRRAIEEVLDKDEEWGDQIKGDDVLRATSKKNKNGGLGDFASFYLTLGYVCFQ